MPKTIIYVNNKLGTPDNIHSLLADCFPAHELYVTGNASMIAYRIDEKTIFPKDIAIVCFRPDDQKSIDLLERLRQNGYRGHAINIAKEKTTDDTCRLFVASAPELGAGLVRIMKIYTP